ncbi:hypothetical protein KAURM247S_00953 [Kitasatospora aureofaciens]
MARCEVEAGGPGQQLRDTVISGGARPEDGLLRPRAASNTVIRQALGDLALHGLVASDGNTRDRHKTWRLEGSAGLGAAGQVLGLPRPEMGGTARGAGRSGAQHAMAVNETIAAFVLGGSAPGAAGGVGTVRSWRIFSGAGWCASRAMVCDTHRFVLLSDRIGGCRLAARRCPARCPCSPPSGPSRASCCSPPSPSGAVEDCPARCPAANSARLGAGRRITRSERSRPRTCTGRSPSRWAMRGAS